MNNNVDDVLKRLDAMCRMEHDDLSVACDARDTINGLRAQLGAANREAESAKQRANRCDEYRIAADAEAKLADTYKRVYDGLRADLEKHVTGLRHVETLPEAREVMIHALPEADVLEAILKRWGR